MSIYAHDSEGLGAVARFVADGWTHSECVVVVATRPHLALIDALLVDQGHDPGARAADGHYLALDAEQTLRELLVDGRLDTTRFRERVGEMLAQASGAGLPVRVFGEMVVLLWQQGRIDDAIALERLWNELQRDQELSLLCAYPTNVFDRAELVDVRRVCELHTDLLPPRPGHPTEGATFGAGHAVSRVYLPTPGSVPAARHFVVDVLRSWGDDALAADAALIVTELATNALAHAASPFRTVVDRRHRGVRICVEDAADVPVEPTRARTDEVHGRGVEIVAALSERWGYTPVPGGKVVWAELPQDPERSRAG